MLVENSLEQVLAVTEQQVVDVTKPVVEMAFVAALVAALILGVEKFAVAAADHSPVVPSAVAGQSVAVVVVVVATVAVVQRQVAAVAVVVASFVLVASFLFSYQC